MGNSYPEKRLPDDLDEIRAWMQAEFSAAATAFVPLHGGFFSRAYAFHSRGRDYVLRLNNALYAAEGFAKDAYAYAHFASATVPIPQLFLTGQRGDDWFAISARARGRSLATCSVAERRAVFPALLDTLDAFSQAALGAASGYGPWGAAGNAPYPYWYDYLAAIVENDSAGYFQDWHRLFTESFLERDLYQKVYAVMLRLLVACPEERSLIHNDYWFENIIVADGQVTGVIDWANALYGDPLYEIARLSWGAAWPGWWYPDGAAVLAKRYGTLPHFAQRLAAYQCHLALEDLRFYAKTGKTAEYAWARDRLLSLLATAQ